VFLRRIAVDVQALGSNFYALFNAGIREPNLAPSQCQGSSTSEMDMPALESRILPIPMSALGPGFSSSSTISQTANPELTQNAVQQTTL